MLTDKEKQFMYYWETERVKQSSFTSKLMNGLPMATIFAFPIVLLVFVVKIFLPEWNTRVSNISNGTMITIVVALVLCIFFFSFFRMHYKWEMNEQLYLELKSKASKENKIKKLNH